MPVRADLCVLVVWGHTGADKTEWRWQPVYDVHSCLFSKLLEKLQRE